MMYMHHHSVQRSPQLFTSSALCLLISLCSPTFSSRHHWFSCCLHTFACFQYVGMSRYAVISDWRLSLSSMCLSVLRDLHGLIAHVFLIVVESLGCVWLFTTSCTAARQASLAFPISWSLIKLMSIESVMPSNHLILCCPLLLPPQSFPASGSFQTSQFFAWGGQSVGVSASTSVLPMNTQDWFPLGWTGWISLQSKGLSRVFSNTTVQKHQFFGAQLSS